MDLGYILEVEPIELADRLDESQENRLKMIPWFWTLGTHTSDGAV